jgi:hypothetical protein
MARTLAPELPFRDAAQFLIHQRNEAVECALIAVGKVPKQESDRARIGHLRYRIVPSITKPVRRAERINFGVSPICTT